MKNPTVIMAWAMLGVVVAFAASGRFASAAVDVRIAPLKATGGAIGKGPDNKPIEERFTTALQKLLAESAKGRFGTSGTTKDSDFVVEGELSALQTAKNTAGGYLCTVRLFQTGKSGRRLVGQWAGTAKTVRDLTGNITKDKSISNLGLAGELASRIGAVVSASMGTAAGETPKTSAVLTPAVYNALIKTATANRRLKVDVVSGGATDDKLRSTLVPGEKYHLLVSAQDAGTVYVLALVSDAENDGKPKSPYAQNEAPAALPGRSVLLPPNAPFTAPQTGTADWVVLVRRKPADKATDKAGAAPSASVIVPRSAGGIGVPGFALLPGATTDDPYGVADTPPGYGVPDVPPGAGVTIIGGALAATPIALPKPVVTTAKSELDAETERILRMMQSDPAGTWVALEIKLPVIPPVKDGKESKDDKKSGTVAPTANSGAGAPKP